ncbi:hypothetical protein QAD02_002270, partial [Eretmocerus hayati]
LSSGEVSMDSWNLREQLCLASSVLKSGDQDWMTVSHSIKSIADRVSMRPSDWFSHKSCAQQYAHLIENVNIPRRRKKDVGETSVECIVKRLTHDRISELSRLLEFERGSYLQLKNEWSLLKNGTISNDKLRKMWCVLEEEKELARDNVELCCFRDQDNSGEIPPKINPFDGEPNIDLSQRGIVWSDEKIDGGECINRTRDVSSSVSNSLRQALDVEISLTETNVMKLSSPLAAKTFENSGRLIVQSSLPGESGLSDTHHASQALLPRNVPTLTKLLGVSSPKIQGTAHYDSLSCTSSSRLENFETCSGKETSTGAIETKYCRESMDVNSPLPGRNGCETSKIDINLDHGTMSREESTQEDKIDKVTRDIGETTERGVLNDPSTSDVASSSGDVFSSSHSRVIRPSGALSPKDSDDSNFSSDTPSNEMCIGEIDSSTSNIAEIIGTPIDSMNTNAPDEFFQNRADPESSDQTPAVCVKMIGSEATRTRVKMDDELRLNDLSTDNVPLLKKSIPQAATKNVDTVNEESIRKFDGYREFFHGTRDNAHQRTAECCETASNESIEVNADILLVLEHGDVSSSLEETRNRVEQEAHPHNSATNVTSSRE